MIDKEDQIILRKFGEHVKYLREKKALSLRALSYACNIDNSKISKIEQGKINLTLLTILELAAGLEVPAAELLNFLKKH